MGIFKKIFLGLAVFGIVSLTVTAIASGGLQAGGGGVYDEGGSTENVYLNLAPEDIDPQVSKAEAVTIAENSIHLPGNYSVTLVKTDFENPCWRILSQENHFVDLLIGSETGEVKEILTEFNFDPEVKPIRVSAGNKVEFAREKVRELTDISSGLESPKKVEGLKNRWKIMWGQNVSDRTLSITLDLVGNVASFYDDWKR